MRADVPLAVIGVACRFPGAPDKQTFWNNIVADVYSIRPMPPERFHRERYFDPEVGAYGKSYCDLGGLLDEHPFDGTTFRIPPKVVESTDIAQLWALEVARDTLADAGFDQDGLKGRNCGVVIGHARGSMLTADMAFSTAVEGMVRTLDGHPDLVSAATCKSAVDAIHGAYPRRTEDGGTGTIASALAGRISSTFELTGRHMVVDAACASSFAALDVAARAVRRGRMDFALVGGASYSQELSVILFAQSRALSGDGSFPFDRRANGFISSDGMGFLLITRLDEALRNGYDVKAVIHGVGGSCDGKGKALWAPRKEGQVVAMRRAYASSGIDPATIGLIEAHATSTPIGDACEIESLEEVYADALGGRRLPIGSVKGNIGHCREAAGAAGLIKAILALQHQTLPPTGNFREANPEIPWDDVCTEVSREARPWASDGPRRAGCNAFGIGGLNYHVIVEEPPPKTRVYASAAIDRTPCPIAIVGMGTRLPGANSIDEFWANLTSGRDVFVDVPDNRWSKDVYYQDSDRTPYRTYAKRGGFIENFDPNWRLYKVPPKLVERNDPLQFLLLESAIDAIEDARIDLSKVDRTRVSVLMGTVFGSDYALELSLSIRALELAEVIAQQAGRADDTDYIDQVAAALRAALPSINEDSSGSFSSSTLASRIAKTLDLMGPTFTMDAACASSLASLDTACDLLADGAVDLVLYGGGDRAMRVQRYEAYCQFHAISRGDAPRPFDASADGFLPGEGAAVCALKRLDDALADGDRIRAVIRGIGSSSDGERKSLHKPSPRGLALAMRRAFDGAGVDPEQVPFVECHGGGTPSGDATETEALRAVYLANGRTDPVTIGTVKSNVGHTQGAAGVISLAKTVLALEKGRLPPTLRFDKPHRNLHFEAGIRVNSETEPYPANSPGRYAAVSAMGLGGINYHVVLEAPPRPLGSDRVHVLRAADERALGEALRNTDAAAWFETKDLGRGPVVCAIAADDASGLNDRLATARKAGLLPGTKAFLARQGIFVRTKARQGNKTCVLFSGQGSQYAGMMKALADVCPGARQVADRIDAWLTRRGEAALTPIIWGDDPIPADIFTVQASVLCADLMAFAALRAAGVRPDVVTGHSFGDYAALVAAGSWSLEDALTATRARSDAIESAVRPGGMASVTASIEVVDDILASLAAGVVEPSNINAPSQTVISGEPAALDAALDAFAARGIETKRLPIPRPFHSTLMAAAADALRESLSNIPLSAPTIEFVSSVSGQVERDPAAIRNTLIEQLTRPVRFVTQVELLVGLGCDVFIESGPRGVLAGLTRQIVEKIPADVDVVTTDDADRPGVWAVGRVVAMTRANEAADAEPEHTVRESNGHSGATPVAALGIALFEGDEADALLDDPEFAKFWSKTRPSIAQLVRGLWAAERPEEVVEAPAADETTSQATLTLPSATKEEVETFLIDAICEETGYPPDIIEMDADLEADLGIDTVKQAQVMGKVRDKYGLKTDESMSLRDFPSLGHIVEYVSKQLAERATSTRPRVAIPVVDLTARRTGQPTRAPAPTTQAPATRVDATSVAPMVEAPPVEALPVPEPVTAVDTDRPRLASDAVTVLELTGTAREIGRAHGEALRSTIRDTIDRYEAFLGGKGLTMTSVPEATRLLPALFDAASLDEIKGVAEAIDVPFEFLVAYNLDTALFPAFSTGCTQALRTAEANDGTLLHMANEDSPLRLHLGGSHPRVVQIRKRTDGPIPDRKTVHFSLAGQICGVNALNDAGITVSSCTLLDRATPLGLPEGLPHPQIVKRIAEEASSLTEAMAIARGTRRSGRWSLLVSDADRDEAAYLEYDGDSILLEGRVPGTWVSTNHAIAGPAPGQTVPEHSQHRATRAGALVRTDSALSVGDAQGILRDRFDIARNRVVDHPTMNTIRRVDNVMSLVVDGAARRLHVTDRVGDPAGFITIEYGRDSHVPGSGGDATSASSPESAASSGLAVQSVSTLTAEGRGIIEMTEVMRRYVVRVVPEAVPEAAPGAAPEATGPFRASVVLLVGGDRTRELAQVLESRGAKVEVVGNCAAALNALSRLGDVDTLGILLDPADDRTEWALTDSQWKLRRAAALSGPFELVRAWAPGRKSGCLFGVTVLGGACGFDNVTQGSPEGGALMGLLKAVRREFDDLQVQAFDVSPSASASAIARGLMNELDAGSPRLEVGLLRKTRMRLVMAPRAATGWTGEANLPSTWLVTGGARGVTSKICERLAELYRPTLRLIGRHELPSDDELARLRALDEEGLDAEKQAYLRTLKTEPNFTPKLWADKCEALDKTLEIDATLTGLQALGSHATYHAVDVANRSALDATLSRIRALGPIDGLIHGAGYELAKPLDAKSDEIFSRTVAKTDGLVHLLALTRQDKLTHVVGFSSVSGRFGGHGQTDYAVANEAAARLLATYRNGRPETRACTMSWPAWGEVGLAARSSSKVFLERTGQKFMTPDEGANHFVRELWAGLPESEVVFCERLEALDLDRILPDETRIDRWRQLDRRATGLPLIDNVVLLAGDRIIAERTISADEPFLDQHRMGPMPILPAVIGLEMMREVLALGGGQWTVGDVSIETPLKVRPGQTATVRVVLDGDDLLVTASARRPDGVVLEPERVHLRGRRVAPQPLPDRAAPPWDGEPSPFPYPRQYDRTRGSRLMYHGPVFRCLQGVLPGTGGGAAKLVVPPVEALVRGSSRDAWLLNSALLDGCLQAAGLLGRIMFKLSALPIGFGRIDVAPRATRAAGEDVILEVRISTHGDDELKSDLLAIGTDGPLIYVEGYRSRVMRGLG